MNKRIGNMIKTLREEAEISQNDLARGIMTVADLSRAERGEKELDKMYLEALFQRVGKSVDKLELAISMEEYRLIEGKHIILNCLSIGELENAEEHLQKYRGYIKKEKPLHLQAWLLLQAVKEYMEKRKRKEMTERLKEALEVTFPDWKKAELREYYLCVQEIQILLLLFYLYLEEHFEKNSRGEERIVHRLEELYVYVDKRYTDEEERTKVYPWCAWLLGTVYRKQGNFGKAYKLCQSGQKCLAESGGLSMMKELLQIQVECMERIGINEGLQQLQKQIEAVDYLYEVIGKTQPKEPMIQLLVTSMQGEVIITNELIRELRLAYGMSQEELTEGICTQETLSRIENGMRSPNKNKLHAMLRKLGVERGAYYGFVEADEYCIYEKVRAYKRSLGKLSRKEAEELLEELENCLDKKSAVNRQFIEAAKVGSRIHIKGAECEEELQELRELLNITLKDYEEKGLYRVPFRQEVVILNRMAIGLRQMGRGEEMIKIYRRILERYEKSAVKEVFHSVSLFLVYVNYGGVLEDMNYLQEAKEIDKEGISVMLDCKRGDIAGHILANLSCVYKKERNTELAEKSLRNGYYLTILYEYDNYKDKLRNAYGQWFARELV